MLKKLKLAISILLIMFCLASLAIAFLAIWDAMSNELAKEAFLKISYTFGALLLCSLGILLVIKISEDK